MIRRLKDMTILPDLSEAQKKAFLEEAPGPTKAVLKFIAESKTRTLKEYEVSSYNRALAVLVGSINITNNNKNELTEQRLIALKAKKEVLYFFSKILKRNIAMIPFKGWKNVKPGFDEWTVDEVLSLLRSGIDIKILDKVRSGIDGEILS